MNKSIFFALFICGVCATGIYAQQKSPVDYADPLIGTSESRWMLNPGAALPFGMVQLSPDNQSQYWKSGYEYTIGSVFGFSHIHAWTMSGLSVMPTKGVLNSIHLSACRCTHQYWEHCRPPVANRQGYRKG